MDSLLKAENHISPITGKNREVMLEVISEKTVVQVEPIEPDQSSVFDEKTIVLDEKPKRSISDYTPDVAGSFSDRQSSDGYSEGSQSAMHRRTVNDNMLVNCAMPLIHQAMSMASSSEPADIQAVRSSLISDMRRFQNKAEQCISDQRHIVAARYILCSFIDEAIATTPWGVSHRWGAESLLSCFHHETYGGDGFFTLLERAMQQPQQYLDLLELMYVCLSLGFSGRYRVDAQGATKLENIRESMMTTIAANQKPDNRGVVVGDVHRQVAIKKRAKWLGPVVISTLLLGNAAGYWVLSNQLEARMDTASEYVLSSMGVSN
ncbi:type IVB secretion system protein IcmH/DotU [Alkalimarinus alittae]|uniref:Type IVB secretion system protein IcmH/DotU n=1 Tax=Alkalimarinus alittae TaxID=2961619 RepID=A0ABY6N5H1_9ALTE|nr:type IVB secretion system protein IcmH/DotU [Alkalimarinus alittae]UZE97336.1 type IVB secretion system protein IcmH/DotU [Alkalimarinus alittae]